MLTRATSACALLCALALSTVADAKPHTTIGKASWYNDKRTASGERFDPQGFTAAHRTLPFGTWAEVCSLHKMQVARCVAVRINDRGPFVRGRVIDTTPSAFKRIAPLHRGTVRVTVTPVIHTRELRNALAALNRTSTARREVMQSEQAGLLRQHDSPGENVASPRLAAHGSVTAGAYIYEQALVMLASVDLEQPQPGPNPINIGNIFTRFVESLLRPIGNCRAFDTVDPVTRRVVSDVARELGGTAYAFSCYRDAVHNRRVRGARFSQHIRRKALDFRVVKDGKVVSPRRVALAARRHPLMKHAGGIGTYCGNTVHVDSGPRRTWHWGCGKKRTRLAYRKQHRG